MIFGGSYADNSGCDWRDRLSAFIFAAGLIVVGLGVLGISGGIASLFANASLAFWIVLCGAIFGALQLIARW